MKFPPDADFDDIFGAWGVTQKEGQQVADFFRGAVLTAQARQDAGTMPRGHNVDSYAFEALTMECNVGELATLEDLDHDELEQILAWHQL